RDLAAEVAVCDAGRDFGDVTHLAGEVAGHRVHRLGEVAPHTGDTLHIGLPAQLSFRTYFAGHAGHFGGERFQLIHHRVDRVLQLENLALCVDRDLGGEVALRDARRYLGDVTYLEGEVAGHAVHRVREIFPDT